MSKYVLSTLILLTLLSTNNLLAQTCRSESEIPATTPTSAFNDNGDGTLTDTRTGLMWMKCPLGQSGSDCATGSANTYTWDQALQAPNGFSYAGYSDWRVPNIKELRSIIEEQCFDPAINLAIFPATPSTYFWSSSPNAGNSSYAWFVDFGVDIGGGIALFYDRDYDMRLPSCTGFLPPLMESPTARAMKWRAGSKRP